MANALDNIALDFIREIMAKTSEHCSTIDQINKVLQAYDTYGDLESLQAEMEQRLRKKEADSLK